MEKEKIAKEIKSIADQLNNAFKEAEDLGLTIVVNGSTGFQSIEVQVQDRIVY